MAERWGRILGAARHYGPALLPFVLRAPLRRYVPRVTLAKLAAKCLLGWRVRPR